MTLSPESLPAELLLKRRQFLWLAQQEAKRRRTEIANRAKLEQSLVKFHRAAWPIFDPAEYLHNWSIDAVADHLQATVLGHIRILIITQPPRTMKSSIVACSFPPFVWAQAKRLPLSGPQVKFMNIAYDPDLSIRDATKSRRILDSPWYQDRWGDRFQMLRDRDRLDNYENSLGGFRLATSIGGKITGEGADCIIIDDPINARKANWESARQDVNQFWDESLPTRLNSPKEGAFIIIMQRLHEDDLVGHILDKSDYDQDDIVHLNLPMEYDQNLDTRTYVMGELFFEDPREEPDELLWPERFPRDVVDRLKTTMGPFAASAQLQQQPAPRGGGIIDRMWWKLWDWDAYTQSQGADAGEDDGILRYPACELIIGSVDTRYGSSPGEKKEEQENAFDAMTVFGVFNDKRHRVNAVMMEAWRGRYKLRAVYPDDCLTDEERKPHWGLAEKIADTVRRRHISILLIENKTRGGDLAEELRRLLRDLDVSIILLEPDGNKAARLYAVQPMFADGRVWAPSKAWAEAVITEVSQFPKGKFKDFCDTVSQALSWLRKSGVLLLGTEADAEYIEEQVFRPRKKAVYDV